MVHKLVVLKADRFSTEGTLNWDFHGFLHLVWRYPDFHLKVSLQPASFSRTLLSSNCCGYLPALTPFISATVDAGHPAQTVFAANQQHDG